MNILCFPWLLSSFNLIIVHGQPLARPVARSFMSPEEFLLTRLDFTAGSSSSSVHFYHWWCNIVGATSLVVPTTTFATLLILKGNAKVASFFAFSRRRLSLFLHLQTLQRLAQIKWTFVSVISVGFFTGLFIGWRCLTPSSLSLYASLFGSPAWIRSRSSRQLFILLIS